MKRLYVNENKLSKQKTLSDTPNKFISISIEVMFIVHENIYVYIPIPTKFDMQYRESTNIGYTTEITKRTGQ